MTLDPNNEKLIRLNRLLQQNKFRTLKYYRTGVIVLLVGHLAWVYLYIANRAAPTSPDAFMTVTSVHVPNHTEGQDPEIIYSRHIRQHFRARWFIEARHWDTKRRVDHCRTGQSEDAYEPGIFSNPMRLRFYAGWRRPQDCILGPGCYYLFSTWFILDLDRQTSRPVENTSNRFCITSKK